jgi:outer membrane receptor protein involved in Fe transport
MARNEAVRVDRWETKNKPFLSGRVRTRRYIIFFSIGYVLISTLNLFAQGGSSGGSVSGSIISRPSGKALESAGIVLFQASDSVIVSGTTTSGDGKFEIDHIPYGSYYLVLSCIGYRDTTSAIFIIDSGHPKQTFEELSITQIALPQKGIVVTEEKPTYNNFIDRKVYNVEKDMMSQTGSAGDLLQNVPSVSVDIDGNVSLRGSQNVLMLLNGRPSPLLGKNRADFLENLPASSIERIEVITNPSAKYKPEGTSGIINIVLKKKRDRGLNGSISVNGGPGRRGNGNISLNYNPGHLNLFGSYGIRKDSRDRYTHDVRAYFDQQSGLNSYYNEDLKSLARPFANIATLAMDYDLDNATHLGVSGDYFRRDFTRNDKSVKDYEDNQNQLTGANIRSRHDLEYEIENSAMAYFERSFGKEDNKLHLEYNISEQPEKEDNHYTVTYQLPVQNPTYDNNLVKNHEWQHQLSLDYTNPLSENSDLEAGASYEFDKQDQNSLVDYFDSTLNSFVPDTGQTNRFIFDQGISAVYGTFKHSFGNFSAMAGLRYEYARVKSNLLNDNSIIINSYSNLYPSLHLAYDLNKTSELQLNYSRRTNRPEGEDLNPFPEYRDPLNLYIGNPHLLPEYIHSVEFGCQFGKKQLTVTPSIYYQYRYNNMTSVTQPLRDSVLLTTRENLAHDQSAGLEIIVKGSMGKYLDTDVSANVFHNTIDASNIGFSNNKSTVSWSGTFNISLKPKPATTLEMNSYYRSARLTPQGKYLPSFTANFGVRQDLLQEKLSIILTASDLLKTQQRKTELRTAWLNRDMKYTRDAQIIYLGASYHFGTPPKRGKEKPIEFDTGQ